VEVFGLPPKIGFDNVKSAMLTSRGITLF
jgi:hypothetical protein